MKKIILGTCTLLFSANLFSQPYVGVSVGAYGFFDHSARVSGFFDNGKIGFVGGGLIGYNFDFNANWKLGLEGFIEGTNITINAHNVLTPNLTSVKERNNEGVRILPSYRFIPQGEGHIIAGYVHGNFNYQDTDHALNNNFTRNGYQLGLGGSFCLTDHFSLRTDGIYSNYNSYNIVVHDDPHVANISSLEGLLTAVYKFS